MPDPIEILTAMAAAGTLTAALVLVFGWPRRTPSPARLASGGILGIALGFAAGSWLLGIRPKWPPREDLDRLHEVILPTVAILELAIAWLGLVRSAWLGRALLAIALAPAVLFGSVYFDPHQIEAWPASTWGLLAGLAAAILLSWWSASALDRRSGSMAIVLAVVSAGAGVTIMLSGYLSGGKLGLVLGATLAASAFASLRVNGHRAEGGLAVAVVLLASLLIAGHFFVSLTTPHAVILAAAPLACWAIEWIRLPPWVRTTARVAIVAIPVALVTWQAYETFLINSRTPTNPYLQYGM